MTPRAITGLGIACALGTGAEAFFAAMQAPARLSTRPPAPITSFDSAKYDAPPIVEVPDFDAKLYLGEKGLRSLDRLTKLLVVAARLCLQDAGIKKDGQFIALSAAQVGVCCSNAYGSLEAITELDRVAKLEAPRYINPAKFPNTVSNSASGYVSIWEELKALNVSVSDGNCGGLDVMGCADLFLSSRRADAIITGGGEAMSEALFLAFEKLGALGDGRLGEGAAFVALEPTDLARARGARLYAEVVGYATSFVSGGVDSPLVVASREAITRSITQALEDAKVTAHEIDVVSSSVSGLRHFDDEELAAIASVTGDTPIAAPKLILGETLGAGGAMSVAAALTWLGGAPVSPIVRGDAPKKTETILVTTVGYYGNASALVLRKPS